ncbi:L,D-transpeptidase [Salinisphaera sp. T31B1]|uniref:L,D-transpeptidase n=1 Tax=Salinisphaera sp. T31B1 TaxID=727963 RepID=UPI0033415076
MTAPTIDIDLHAQRLTLLDADGHTIEGYDVSTASKGGGEFENSHQTPRGHHRIRAKIGAGAAPGTVFNARRPTGEIYSVELAEAAPRRDWILSRILWLCGEEIGRNRLGAMDSMRRHIYIHGAADTAVMGKPGSLGCIRMTNSDVIDLFERVPVGTKVFIHE